LNEKVEGAAADDTASLGKKHDEKRDEKLHEKFRF
jgi:hypothetical protein